eukprot:2406788-Prymnesium_polylepis.1
MIRGRRRARIRRHPSRSRRCDACARVDMRVSVASRAEPQWRLLAHTRHGRRSSGLRGGRALQRYSRSR